MPTSPCPTAIVTGASRGIGRAIAVALGQRGYAVAVNYLGNVDAANETASLVKDAGGEAVIVQADVGKTEDRQRLVDETLSAFGRIDMLVNNAGIPPKYRADILEANEEGYDAVMDTNLRGPFFLTQLVAKHMVETVRASSEDEGKQATPGATGGSPGATGGSPASADASHANAMPRIVNIASVSSYAATPARSQYCIAKAGLSMMTQLYAARLAVEGVLVLELRPGIINTDMARNAKDKYDKLIYEGDLLPMPRWGQPEDVAKLIGAVADGHFDYSPGAVIDVDGGFRIRRL